MIDKELARNIGEEIEQINISEKKSISFSDQEKVVTPWIEIKDFEDIKKISFKSRCDIIFKKFGTEEYYMLKTVNFSFAINLLLVPYHIVLFYRSYYKPIYDIETINKLTDFYSNTNDIMTKIDGIDFMNCREQYIKEWDQYKKDVRTMQEYYKGQGLKHELL